MGYEGRNNPEIQMPFIAEIVMGLLALAASYLYFRDSFLLLACLLLVAVLVLRRNAWAVSAAVLMTLAFDLYQRQRMEELRIVIILLGVGVVLQLIAALWQRYQLGYWGSSFTENAVFAAIGLAIGYGIQFHICRPTVNEISVSGILYIWQALVGCAVAVAMEPMATVNYTGSWLPTYIEPKPGMEQLSPLFFATMGLVFLRMFFLTPGTWAMFMAGFRASGLAIWNPVRVLRYVWHTFWGTQLVGIPTFFVLLVLGGVSLLLRFSGNTSFNNFLDMTALITILASIIIGSAWGASRGG